MYSSAQRLSTISAIGCAVNVVGLLMYWLMSGSLMLNFALSLGITMFMLSSTLIFLLLTVAMRSLCQDLESEYENSNMKFREINKKLKEIEDRL